jgi:hypothetical protein
MRRSKSPGGLTTFSEDQGKRRGPHTALSDAQLHNRRDQLVQIFEGEWGEIGLELPRCKKADDVARIFGPLAESPSWIAGVVELFCRPSSEPASNTDLRKVRFERHKLAEPTRIADELRRRAAEQLERVNWAFAQAAGRSRRIVRRARRQTRKQLWKTTQRWRSLTERERHLEQRLRSLEASFARQELVRFVRSKRYEVMPVALANAGAGLPYIGWRQSMRRCARTQSVVADGRSIQIFKAIRYLAAGANKRSKIAFVRSFHENIPLLPSRYRLARAELAEKWLYLERAIRQAYQPKLQLRALPFEITKRYFKQLSSQSQVDMVLAERARITLPRPKVPV